MFKVADDGCLLMPHGLFNLLKHIIIKLQSFLKIFIRLAIDGLIELKNKLFINLKSAKMVLFMFDPKQNAA